MNTYETFATVQSEGQVHVTGVPFEPGTEVEVIITAKPRPQDDLSHSKELALAASRERMRDLFRTIKGFCNSPRIPREDLYERGSFH
jgi:hypothetical protein